MSDLLCTFSGKFGDIIFSLATVKAISELFNRRVDFRCMPYYQSLIPLVASQPYIETAGVYEDWIRTHSNHGDGPWQPPERYEKEYKQFWHLSYRGHPGITAPEMPLIDFTAFQQGIRLKEPVIPFIFADDTVEPLATPIHFSSGQFMEVVNQNRLVAYAFNEQYEQQKKEFFASLYSETQGAVEFFNLNTVGWKEAAWVISKSLLFVGCRSANWVVAQGLGKEAVIFEPHPARHAKGHLGRVFSCPYGRETPMPFGMPAIESGKVAAAIIKSRMEKVANA